MPSLRVFATTSHPFGSGPVMGLKVAVHGFYRALIEFAGFEHYLFFAQTANLENLKNQFVEKYHLNEELSKKVTFLPTQELPLYIAQGKIDVLHRGDPRIDAYINLRNLAKPGARPVITGVTHSLNNPSDYNHFLQLLLMSPREGSSIFCTSEAARGLLNRLFSRLKTSLCLNDTTSLPRLDKIPLGMDIVLSKLTKQEARDKFGIKPEQVVILYVGRIHSLVKADLRPFVRMFMELKKKHKELLFCLAGGVSSGEEHEVKMIQDEAERYGVRSSLACYPQITEEGKQTLYRASDIFFSPVDNFQETFGLSLLEAMSYELPIICSDWGGYRDLVQDGVNGFLIRTMCYELPKVDLFFNPSMQYLPFELSQSVFLDWGQLIEKFDLLIEQPELRKKLGEGGKRNAENYTWKRIIDQHVEIWKELSFEKTNPDRTEVKRISLSQADLFKDYLSLVLPDSAMFRAAEKEEPLPLAERHPFVTPLIEKDLLEVIFRKISKGESTSLDKISQEMNIPVATLRLPISWLFKYGYLKKL